MFNFLRSNNINNVNVAKETSDVDVNLKNKVGGGFFSIQTDVPGTGILKFCFIFYRYMTKYC
jgi:hypothetical protein